MRDQAVRIASAIMIATAIFTGAAIVRGITWSLGHNDRFASHAAQALPER